MDLRGSVVQKRANVVQKRADIVQKRVNVVQQRGIVVDSRSTCLAPTCHLSRINVTIYIDITYYK